MSGSNNKKHRSKKRKSLEANPPFPETSKRRQDPSVSLDSALSLASSLKRQRGTADSTPLPPKWSEQSKFPKMQSFLTPEDDRNAFRSCQKECYRGFYWESPDTLPQSFHSTFDSALDALYEEGLFLHDAVQPGGKRLSRTFVTRTLIGKPGSTYRYLGLRLFSHPWSATTKHDDDKDDNDSACRTLVEDWGYSRACAKALLQMGALNEELVQRTQRILEQESAPHVPNGLVGSADYNLTLVNRMEPTIVQKDLKPEKLYGMGKTSVSWHKDSGLMDFSSIAVYHTFRETEADIERQEAVPWKVALRVASSDVSTPPLAVPLPSGSVYYLLDDFNHQHEHAVLAGTNQLRYSSTHRVAREGRGTWQYIRDKCKEMLPEISQDSMASNLQPKQLVKRTRACQQLLTEIEFEWLRQWGIQGELHAKLHPYWHKPIARLQGWFEDLERETIQTMALLRDPSKRSEKSLHKSITEDTFDVLIEAMEERMKLRAAWNERESDPIFQSMPENMRPLKSPVLDRSSHDDSRHLSENLPGLVADIRKWRKLFVSQKGKQGGKHGVPSRSDLTKKETRKIASNWEQMKSKLSKTTSK